MSAFSFRTITMLAIGAGLGFVAATISCQPSSTAEAGSAPGIALPATAVTAAGQQGGRARLTNPTGEVSNPYSYFPGTEELGPDEIRVVACGTGMPATGR